MSGTVVPWYRYPGFALGVLGSQKSFRKNPVLGHPYLNRMGLHRERVRLAAGLASYRRKLVGLPVSAAERRAFDEDGFVLRENALPEDVFRHIKEFLQTEPLPAREMRQGQAVTRMIPINPAALHKLPDLARFSRDPSVAGLIRYVGGLGGDPIHFVQTVMAEPAIKQADPQTALHADTFHSSAKAWLFLQDVGPDDGPFVFVPGSHRLTAERLEWEYQQSLLAMSDSRSHHAEGSFRISESDLSQLGSFAPRKVTVKANTLVIADTYAFHSRAVSHKQTTRVELHAYHRSNPFTPLPFSPLALIPGLRDRKLDIYLAMADRKAERAKRRPTWVDVGPSTAFEPPHL